MAVKPVILSMTPWDSTDEYQLNFTYAGGMPVSNRLIIYDANSGSLVYDKIETSSHFYHTIEANTLRVNGAKGNGHQFRAYITVTENNHIESPTSDEVYFWCFETPTFRLIFPSLDTYNSPNVQALIYYAQEEGEELYSYSYKLYNYSKILIADSGVMYKKSGIAEPYISHWFKGLSDKTHYYIQAEGVTRKGIPLKTDMKHFFVDYEGKEITSVLNLYSDANATVTGNLNIIAIDADESSEDYTYIGSQVVLLNKDLHYNNSFEIVSDFTCSLKARMTHGNLQLLKMNRKNASGYIEITSNLYEEDAIEKVFYRLRVNNGLSDYNLFSEPMIVSDDDQVIIHFRRKNNVYKLIVYKL